MKRAGDKRMYLIEEDPKRKTPRVTPIWGQRSASGIVAYTRFRRDDRMWAAPLEAFETELQAWQQLARVVAESVAKAHHTLKTAATFSLTVQRQIKRLTPKARGRR